MASSSMHVCTICQDGGITNKADTWCTECEVFIVETVKPHRRSRISKNHKTMSVEDYQKLPAFIQDISSQCIDHNKKYELYCSVHACPCCVQCITDKHPKCQDLKPMSDILKQVKSSASVELFEKDLKDMKENLDNAVQYLKSRISTSNIKKTKAVEEIRSMKKSIVDYLNKLEQQIIADLGHEHKKLISNMDTIVQQLEKRASQIGKMQGDFLKMTQYATELQMYFGLKEIETTTSEAAKYIETLESGNHFDDKNLEINISSHLRSILENVESFGDININTTVSTLRLKTGRKDQAQHLTSNIPGIEQIKPTLLRRLIIQEEFKFLGSETCLILSDAVTLGQKNETVLVDIEKNKIIQTIKLSHYCNGVASDKNLFVISCIGASTLVNRNDNSHTILKAASTHGIALFDGYIYGTNVFQNNVFCYKSTGELMWTFMHTDIYKPGGITLDKNGFVYIASSKNNRIVVVSPDGKTCKTILSEADGIKDPLTIDINKETGMMIVACEINDDNYKICHTALIFKT
ncbi:unnamed protein product [Mytilus edulis]|uniref:B box-type domain-containing protein n=1 Tax=Mytilus edulis TaxID=6550 RepID=A0A8S3UUY1_MYTED|nr:unnamed protein product [Mytilus edulis]